jgi:hypothetical protein
VELLRKPHPLGCGGCHIMFGKKPENIRIRKLSEIQRAQKSSQQLAQAVDKNLKIVLISS